MGNLRRCGLSWRHESSTRCRAAQGPASAAGRSQFAIAPVDAPDALRFASVDDQLPLTDVESQRRSTTHSHPVGLEAAILSRTRSPVTSRSNWANESRTFRVSRPMEVVVLNCWVTATKETD